MCYQISTIHAHAPFPHMIHFSACLYVSRSLCPHSPLSISLLRDRHLFLSPSLHFFSQEESPVDEIPLRLSCFPADNDEPMFHPPSQYCQENDLSLVGNVASKICTPQLSVASLGLQAAAVPIWHTFSCSREDESRVACTLSLEMPTECARYCWDTRLSS